MKKHGAIKLGGLIVMLSLLCSISMAQSSLANPATIFGSTADIFNQDELDASAAITEQIGDWSSSVGYTEYYWYGASTTIENLYIGAYDHGDPGSIVFHIGHGRVDQGQYEMQVSNGSWVSAVNIFDNSVSQSIGHRKVAFLWSCHQGEQIAQMPRAWLHTTSLSADGYASPDYSGQAFIGWSGEAPYLIAEFDDVEEAGYNFLDNFYDAALNMGFYLNFALDYSAWALWQENFDDCIFATGTGAGNMVVYGQGTLIIGTEQYVSNQLDSTYGGSGAFVYTPSYLEGPQDDGQLAYLVAVGNNGYAWITGAMSANADGYITLSGQCGEGYTANLLIYVSTDYNTWNLAGSTTVSGSTAHIIYCGEWPGFNYIGISVVGPNSALAIDAVHVIN